MNCKVCNAKTANIFDATILAKYNIKYFQCQNCGFLQTEQPYWLEEAYKNPINITDTGIMSRNLGLAQQASTLIFFLFNKNSQFVDFAGGYGVFVRLMRDIGFDFYWYDPFTENLFARGFEYSTYLPNIEVLSCFECFEHFEEPLKEIHKLFSISRNIIFSTTLLPNPVPLPNEWGYYGVDHGQHLCFYTKTALKLIADMYGVNFYSSGTVHMFTPKQIPPPLFRMFIKAYRFGLFSFVKFVMKTRMYEDRDLLIQRHSHR